MENHSNNLIGGLIIVAMLISIGSTALVLSEIESVPIITGRATSTPQGITNVTVGATTYITLPVAFIDFGSLYNNEINDTTDNSPAPFQLQNDGTVNVNVTIKGTNIFSGTGAANPSSYYQFACGAGEIACPTGSVVSFTNMPNSTSSTIAVAQLPYVDSGDQVEMDIKVTVPADESAGAKTSTVTFTATQGV
ncbi:MAG: hypothetical protein KKD48_02995 [Nanoarchaeota archaeon]|nr:hypothetical protein [Nanoarchaeota archaeon]